MSHRTLIYGGSYVATSDRAWLVRMWARLTRHLNPDADIAVFNAPGPVVFPNLPRDVAVHHFAENVGHLREKLGELPGDGWGRAMCAGIELAISEGYEHVAFIETDVLFAHSVAEPIGWMVRAGKHFAQGDCPGRAFRESDVFFADVEWLRRTEFVKRYDWPSVKPVDADNRNPEFRVMELGAASLYHLPYYGVRANDREVNEAQAGHLDWLTHADKGLYEAFLRGHGWGDLCDE